MKYRSENNLSWASAKYVGLSLPEVMGALVILGLVCSGVFVVINRCMSSVVDSTLRMQAFEVARENMEKLLASDSASEMAEYGSSEKYPEIEWQTTVETFYEPITDQMWVQAICSAQYMDTEGEIQTIELTHWLTNVTKEQLLQIIDAKKREKELLTEAEQLVETTSEAADYAGVDEQTIEEWVKNDMPTTEDGHYIKIYLDLYEQYDGDPPPEARERVNETYRDVTKGGSVGPRLGGPTGPEPSEPPGPESPGPEPGPCVLPPNPTMEDIMRFIKECM